MRLSIWLPLFTVVLVLALINPGEARRKRRRCNSRWDHEVEYYPDSEFYHFEGTLSGVLFVFSSCSVRAQLYEWWYVHRLGKGQFRFSVIQNVRMVVHALRQTSAFVSRDTRASSARQLLQFRFSVIQNVRMVVHALRQTSAFVSWDTRASSARQLLKDAILLV
ncbi:hypothetical protein LSH36_14g01047 [Paralvinella palmiformis]|uniref:Secreted protein n=1 Tax=Paralvinella palmiformis TaxID=53620 RepID=A0AAD9KCR3_9ANNE|nr:hypothetical protein LSH36_14g01047 [Paralvinella palmiformis]